MPDVGNPDLWCEPFSFVIASPDAIGTRQSRALTTRLLRRLGLLAKTGEDEIAEPVPKRKRGILLLAKTGRGCALQRQGYVGATLQGRAARG